MKITRQKENIKYIGYMGKVEESEMSKIESELPMELYLYKSKNFNLIYEKETGSPVISPVKTQKEAIEILSKHVEQIGVEKLIAVKNKLLNKNGFIFKYEIGSYVR